MEREMTLEQMKSERDAAIKRAAKLESAIAKAVDYRSTYGKPLLVRLDEMVSTFDILRNGLNNANNRAQIAEEHAFQLRQEMDQIESALARAREVQEPDYEKIPTSNR